MTRWTRLGAPSGPITDRTSPPSPAASSLWLGRRAGASIRPYADGYCALLKLRGEDVDRIEAGVRQGEPSVPPPAQVGQPTPAVQPLAEAVHEPSPMPKVAPVRSVVLVVAVASSASEKPFAKAKREAVTALLGEGLSDREIARRVGVSPSTVSAVRKAEPVALHS